jgi:nucleotide-binding universal stress UspA family protein
MKTPVKLLVGLHLEKESEASLDMASALAIRLDAEILLCHVLEHVPHEHGTDYVEKHDLIHFVDVHLARRCEALRAQGIAASPVPTRFGNPRKLLLKQAAENATALVIGAGRKTMLQRVIGASAEKLVRSARLPVFLRHPNDEDDGFHSLLCAVDFSPESERVLANAVSLARQLQAELHVLHVEQHLIIFPDIPDLPSYEVRMPSPDMVGEERLDAFIARVDTEGVSITPHLAMGTPAVEILRTVQDLKPGLLVVGKHGHGGFIDRLVGSVTTHILRSVPCSMLVVGEEDL